MRAIARRPAILLSLLAPFALAVAGCRNDQEPVAPVVVPTATAADSITSTSYGRCGSADYFLQNSQPTFTAQAAGPYANAELLTRAKTWNSGSGAPPDGSNLIVPAGAWVHTGDADNYSTLIIEPGGHLIVDGIFDNKDVIFNMGTIALTSLMRNESALFNTDTVETENTKAGIDNHSIFLNCRGGLIDILAGFLADTAAQNSAFVNDSTAEIRNQGTILLADSLPSFGLIENLYGGLIDNSGHLVNGPGGVFEGLYGGSTLYNQGDLTNEGQITLAGAVIHNLGKITSAGPIRLEQGATDTIPGEILNFSGVVHVTDTVTVQSGGLLDNERQATTTFDAGGSSTGVLVILGGGSVVNHGVLLMHGPLRNDGSFQNERYFEMSANASYDPMFANNDTVFNDGVFEVDGATLNTGVLQSSDSTVFHGLTNTGELDIQGDFETRDSVVNSRNLQNLGTWRNYARIVDTGVGEILAVGGTFDNYGPITLANDALGSLGLSNQGTLNNACDTVAAGVVQCGTIRIDSGSKASGGMENLGLIDNRAGDTITNNYIFTNGNRGAITSEGTIQNNQTLQNDGSISIACGGAYDGSAPVGNPVVNVCGSKVTTFTAVASGSWDNAATWDQDAVPALTDTKVVPNGFTVTIPAGASTTNSGNVNIAGGALDIEGDFTNLGGASITNTGTFTIGGAFTNQGSMTSATDVNASGTFTGTVVNNGTFTNGGAFTTLNGATLANNAQLTNSGSIINQVVGTEGGTPRIDNSGTLTNFAGGTVTNGSSALMHDSGTLSNSGDFTNQGEMHVEGSLTNTPSGTFDNQGTLYDPASGAVANAGVLLDEGYVEVDGAFDNRDSLAIDFSHPANDASAVGIRNNSRITNEGSISIAGGGTGIQNAIASSTLENTGRITVTGTLGIDNRGGTLHNATDASITVLYAGSSEAIENDAYLDNEGVIGVTVSNSNDQGSGILNRDSLVNAAPGTITLSNTDGMGIYNYQGATLHNLGRITVSNDQPGSTSGPSGIRNDATIDNDGTLTLASVNGLGIFNERGTVANHATLNVANTTNGSDYSVGIWDAVNGGTLTNDGTISVSASTSLAVGIENLSTLSNATGGTITVSSHDAGPGIANGTPQEPSAVLHNDGTLTVSNVGGTGLQNAATIDNPGSVTVANTSGTGLDNSGGTLNNPGSVSLACGATYTGNAPVGNAVGDLCLTLTLSASASTAPVGTSDTITAYAVNASHAAVSGATVTFTVGGANTASGSCVTDATGSCAFVYTGTHTGDDAVGARVGAGTSAPTASIDVAWVRLRSSLVYDGQTRGVPGSTVELHAALTDAATGAGLAGDTVTFTLATTSVSAPVATSGAAAASATLDAAPGVYALVAAFAGDATHLPSADTVQFTVLDTVPPVITVPAADTAEATGPAGAVVTFHVTATDNVDGAVTPTCTPASGSTFGLGTTTVTCTAKDSSGNTATASFTVTVEDTTPPATQLTGAQDGGGVALQAGDSTLSTGAVFDFTGTDLVGVRGFACSLDGAPFTTCASPRTLTGLADGEHTFAVRAIDTSGNVDPTPATFSWTVLSPAQGVTRLIATIDGLGLPHGAATSLEAPLRQAATLLGAANPGSSHGVCGKLGAFLNHVAAQDGKQLTGEQAAELRTLAAAVEARIGC